MELVKNIYENEFEEMEGEVYFGYLDKYIHLRFEKDIPIEYVHKVAEKLNELTEEMVCAICKYSVEYCLDKLDDYEDLEMDIEDDEFDDCLNILEYMEIEGLVVNKPNNYEDIGINLEGSCDWDEENGIQWLIKDDQVVYVGPWSMLNIWRSPYENSMFNYAKE